ncbi:CMRF35-like molecule 2 [Salminus brasiliensis]|uniref:CMRF35-like molecule 2 n=1 Tax=Salminus brasiliensis TaxID=930266 RepID=UPI003B8399B3
MRTLRILPLFQVLMCVEVETNSGNVFVGTEGGSVEIRCRYPDSYILTPKYFCRDPCGYSDVFIETQKDDEVVFKGRYSILNTVSARSISVTIRNLRLKDSGVYYCGVDTWGKDILIKVQVSVRKVSASAQPSTAPLSTLPTTESENPTTNSVQTADYSAAATPGLSTSTPVPEFSPGITESRARPTTSASEAKLVVFGVLCGVVCAKLVFLLLFLYKTSAPHTCFSGI